MGSFTRGVKFAREVTNGKTKATETSKAAVSRLVCHSAQASDNFTH
jgi:hypothetical protein